MRTYSIIIPVYNRPDEIADLLQSLVSQTYVHFEVVVVEDGSSICCKNIVDMYADCLTVRYYYIDNSGPGGARNYGVQQSAGEYLIILDSDCILPATYVEQVHESFRYYGADAFGGADRAHPSFSNIQKAVSYAMTSFLTTGGIRGSRKKLDTFYPRSFNMGMRREVYLTLGGFASMRYGEDIDFSIRIINRGYKCCYFPAAWVYHKRRTSFRQFFCQVRHSGRARIELFLKYPKSLKWVHCLPAAFTLGLMGMVFLSLKIPETGYVLLVYALLLFFDALLKNKRFPIAFLSVITSFVQLTGYGSGFLMAIGEKLLFKRKWQSE